MPYDHGPTPRRDQVLEVFINEGRRTVTKVVYSAAGVSRVKPFADPTGAELMSVEAWERKAIW